MVDEMQVLRSNLRTSESLTRDMLDPIMMSPEIALGTLVGSTSNLRLILISSTNVCSSTRTRRGWIAGVMKLEIGPEEFQSMELS